MKVAAPFLVLTGVFALMSLCIVSDSVLMRSAATTALRRKLLVREVDLELGDLDSCLAAIAERASREGFPANYSQGEFLATILQEMQTCASSFGSFSEQCLCTWSVENRTSSQCLSYLLTLSITATPEDGVEIGFIKSYPISIPTKQGSSVQIQRSAFRSCP